MLKNLIRFMLHFDTVYATVINCFERTYTQFQMFADHYRTCLLTSSEVDGHYFTKAHLIKSAWETFTIMQCCKRKKSVKTIFYKTCNKIITCCFLFSSLWDSQQEKAIRRVSVFLLSFCLSSFYKYKFYQ